MNTLAELRVKIDAIDDKIVALLHERADLVLGVKRAKAQGNIDIYTPERERQILDRLAALTPGGSFPPAALERIFSNIISATRSLIGELNVSYAGNECSLAHDAAVKQFGETLQFTPEISIEEVFAKVERGDSHFGVVPARLGAGGTVSRTFDLLMHSKLQIIAELEIKERLALVVGPRFLQSSGMVEVREILADAQSFVRAGEWIRANVPSAKLSLVDSSTHALQKMRESDSAAAVVIESAVERYGLRALALGIEAESSAESRFLVVGYRAPNRTGKDKTSLVCAVPERAGVLRELLQPFSDRGITLLKIESRPVRNRAWEYAFFIDVEGHQSDANVQDAVRVLSEMASFVKVFGSYPLVCPS